MGKFHWHFVEGPSVMLTSWLAALFRDDKGDSRVSGTKGQMGHWNYLQAQAVKPLKLHPLFMQSMFQSPKSHIKSVGFSLHTILHTQVYNALGSFFFFIHGKKVDTRRTIKDCQ